MRRTLPAGLVAAALAFGPAGAGQQQQDCELEILRTPGSRGAMVTTPNGEIRIDQWDGVEAVCGSRWLRADSASYYQTRGVLYLIGDMEYEDGERRLEAERGTYYEREARMRAEGNVRLTNLDGRSTLTTKVLDYYPQNENRAVERLFASERPHLTFYPEPPDAAGATPFDVDADRLHIYGDSLIAGAGRVVAVRGELTANGDSMDLDLGRDRLWLLGQPVVTTGDMMLDGDTILVLMEEQQVREIGAWPDASATGSALSLEAPALRLFVEQEDVSRVIASAGDPERTGAIDSAGREPWAKSESENYILSADSIDIRRPGGRLERVIAVDRALAVSLDEAVPGGGILSSDWLEGDTITGFFAPPDSLAVEGATSEEAVLTRLEASGNARALYYVAEEEGHDGGSDHPAVNYVIGRQITLWLEAGEVQEARAILGAGLYLEPAPEAAPPDTTPGDTARKGGSGDDG